MTADTTDDYSDEVRNQIKRTVKSHIDKVLDEYKSFMKQIYDEEVIKQDQLQRAKEEEEMKKAEQEKGHVKQAIFEEAKKKEIEMKERESAMKAAAVEIDASNKGTGSVWNPNSYFWEEKNWNKWSKEKLQELFGSFKHTVPCGTLEVTNAEINGEASISIRKGKKIYAFDFTMTLKWSITLKEGEDEQKVTGEFSFPEISNIALDDGEEVQINLEYKTGMEHRDKLHDHLRGVVFTALRKNIEKYSAEFKEQGS